MPHIMHLTSNLRPCRAKLPPSKGRSNFVPQVRNEETWPPHPLMSRALRRASSAHIYGRWPFPAPAYVSPCWNCHALSGATQPGNGKRANEPRRAMIPPDPQAADSGRNFPSPSIQPRSFDFQGVLLPAIEDRRATLCYDTAYLHILFIFITFKIIPVRPHRAVS